MSLLLLLSVASVSSQDLFSFAVIPPSLPTDEVKRIETVKEDPLPEEEKTFNGHTQFPTNCHSPLWQGFRHGPMGWTANASTETRNLMREIFFNHELTREQKEAKMDELVMKESPQVQEAYLLHKRERADQRSKILTKHDELVARLSPEARQIEATLSAIYQKPGHWHEKRAEVGRIMENVSDNIRIELGAMRDELKKENPWGHHWGHRGHWGRGGRRWGGEEGGDTERGMEGGLNGDQGINAFGM